MEKNKQKEEMSRKDFDAQYLGKPDIISEFIKITSKEAAKKHADHILKQRQQGIL